MTDPPTASAARPEDATPHDRAAAGRSAAPSGGAPRDDRLVATSLFSRVMSRPSLGAVAGALVVYLFFAIYTDKFSTPGGVSTWLDPASTLGIMAVAVAFLMIGGEFDLSAGVMTGSTGLCMGLLAVHVGWNIWLAMLGALVFAVVIGLVNGLLVVRTGLPSFIVTLGTFFILQGLNQGVAQLVTSTVRVDGINTASGYAGARALLGSTFAVGGVTVQASVLWWIGFSLVGSFVLLRTRFGNWVFAVGGNKVAAHSVGVPVARTKVSLFVLTSVAAWFVGMTLALRFTSVTSSQGVGLELQFIIAAVVGGCVLTGGVGSIIGASLGALIFGMAQIGIPFAGWDSNWFFLFLGGMLLMAVFANNIIRSRYQRGRA
jgi:simple sugar transport system permease protein